jgi:high-affinity iron transporter
MLVVTGVLIGGVLLMMVGATVHVLQVVGWLPIHILHGVTIPIWLGTWLGLFPTWEGVGLQLAAALFVIGSYYWAEHRLHTTRPASSAALGADVVKRAQAV